MEASLLNTGKNKEKIETGRFTVNMDKTKVIKYEKSEIRLIETLEDVCPELLKYNMHKERLGSRRFGKKNEKSETFTALEDLVNRGVKVDIGIPLDMWDEPSAEVTQMKKHCESYIELWDDKIEEWYFDDNHFGKSLSEYFCRDIVLQGKDQACLDEVWTGVEKVVHGEQEDEGEGEDGGQYGDNQVKGVEKDEL